ncbi:hypothetical protein KAR48_13840 [bacterium]|nr:hypothetical protein [bacterium]
MKHTPDKQDLFDYMMGEGDNKSRHTIFKHIENCSACQQQLELLNRQKKNIDADLSMLNPSSIPYNVWKKPESVRTRLNWMKMPAFAVSFASLCLIAILTNKLTLQCQSENSSLIVQHDKNDADLAGDILSDWHEKRITVKFVPAGTQEVQYIRASLASN